jgi:5-methyltetrahydrofolate--homocysteine methyltransferase
VRAYGCGRVAYARDAFDGLSLMGRVMDGGFDAHLGARRAEQRAKSGDSRGTPARPAKARRRPVDAARIRLRREELSNGVAVPEPPFWGPRVVARVPVDALVPYLNERMLYQFQWGYRKAGRTLADYMAWAVKDLRPVLKRMLDIAKQQDILVPQAVYGYWPASGEGDDVVLYDPEDGAREVARFGLPRQDRDGGLCIADFLRDAAQGERDVLGLQVVTIGQRASDVAREWFAEDRYRDYLYLHGLGVELAEALAEYVHKRIRGELGFGHEDARDVDKMLRQGYRGSRYSFGYPACPALEDQRQILDLLGAERIGVALSEEFQLHPEQSTSAIVLHHPQAKYFTV